MTDQDDNSRMTETVRARVTEREKKIAEERAAAMGKGISDYIRHLIHQDHEKPFYELLVEDLAKHAEKTPNQFLRDLIHEAQERMTAEILAKASGKKTR